MSGSTPGPWTVTLTCCGHSDGQLSAGSWEEANAIRESYTSGAGVNPHGYSAPTHEPGHRRSAIVAHVDGSLEDPPARHTPGPWTYEEGPKDDADVDDADFVIVEPSAMGEVVATVLGPIRRGSIEANARLIAAAPDLLAALKLVLVPAGHCDTCKGRGGVGAFGAIPICGDCGGSGADERPRRAALAAVAKAEGRS